MTHHRHSHALKWILLLVWVSTLALAYWYLHATGVRFRDMPRVLRLEAQEAGWLGPALIIALYVASAILLLPKAWLDIGSGALYGPWWGSITVLIGLNLVGIIVFWVGRFFGHHLLHDRARRWIDKYDKPLQEEGLVTVLVMRLLLFPFDLVSLGCGMTRMSFRQYLVATFFGSLPGTVTFVVLGGAIMQPRAWFLFGALLIASLGMVLLVRRSTWVRRHLSKREDGSQV